MTTITRCVVVAVTTLFVVGGPAAVVADMFTAIVSLERLLEAENAVAGDLRKFVKLQTERLQKLSRSESFCTLKLSLSLSVSFGT